MVQHGHGFSQGMIRNVLVANPQAAKSSEVQDNLDNRSNQLPQYMRDQIDQGLTHLSPKEYLELSIAKSKRRMDKAITEAFHIYSKDTVNDRSADIVSLYSNTGDINFDYKLVSFYDENNDAVLANALLEVIDSYGLTAIEQDYHDDFVSYRTLINNWKLADKNMATLDSADIAQLLEYSYLGNTISSNAMVLLKLNNKLEYNEPLNWPVEGEKSNKSNKKTEDELTDYFVVYPNPAKDFVTVDYSLRDSEIDALMTISNSEGKVIVSKSLKNAQNQVLIEVSSWASGQYICTFYIGSEIQESQKIVIAK